MPHLLVSPHGLTAIVFPGQPQIDAVDGVFTVENDDTAILMQSKKYGFVPYITTNEDEDSAPEKMPKFGKMKKADLADWLFVRGVEFGEDLNKNQLEVLCIERWENPPSTLKPVEE